MAPVEAYSTDSDEREPSGFTPRKVSSTKLSDAVNAVKVAPHTPRKISKEPATMVESVAGKVNALASKAKKLSTDTAKDPRVQASAASAAGGTVMLGVCGAFVGSVVGGAVGIPFALFTFGLSIPVSAMIGGGAGVVVGGSAGCATGGAVGFTVYTWRTEIKEFFSRTWLSVQTHTANARSFTELKVRAVSAFVLDYKQRLVTGVEGVVAATKKRWSDVVPPMQLHHKSAQVTLASAAAGGVTGGAVGGGVGLVGGAIVGLVPAIFTFGLSIPVCAVVGGSAGVCIGGAGGALGAGATGYGIYTKRAEIRSGVNTVVKRAKKAIGQ